MSLRLRLVILIVALVALVSVALSGLYLDRLLTALTADSIERSELAGQQIYSFLKGTLEEDEAPAEFDDRKSFWYEKVAADKDISAMLLRTMALGSGSIVEINVASQLNQILASSDPDRVGSMLFPLESFSAWLQRPLSRRLRDLVGHSPDYEVTVGLQNENQPIFTIQVVTSNVLLREALLPEVTRLAEVSGGSLLLVLLVTMFATTYLLKPVKTIEQTIDRIAHGTDRAEAHGAMAKEFAVVEDKLNLLGQEYRHVREDAKTLRHNVGELLERMASQLDVATRLAAISRLTSGVAHEIKNPLNAISLRLDLLRAHLGDDNEELVAEVDILTKEVLRLDRVVKTFLDFARPVEVKFSDVDIVALAQEVTQLMVPQARAAGVELLFEAPETSFPVRGDADMLKEALLNLVTNAIEAMHGGGRLEVKAASEGGTVNLEVADTGPGISPEMRNRVFQLYFTTKKQGSGIGLAMVYRTVQLHNGTIGFTSEVGQGTTFHLQFPAVAHYA